VRELIEYELTVNADRKHAGRSDGRNTHSVADKKDDILGSPWTAAVTIVLSLCLYTDGANPYRKDKGDDNCSPYSRSHRYSLRSRARTTPFGRGLTRDSKGTNRL
jgi:hypothetical protein